MPRRMLAVVLTLLIAATPAARLAAQTSAVDPGVDPPVESAAAVWREVASRIDAGTTVVIRLHAGTRFSATVLAARDEGLLMQPKGRLALPVQRVDYASIASLARDDRRGAGAARAAAIGIATGAATFFGILLLLIASIDD